jgi:hypothetical protein
MSAARASVAPNAVAAVKSATPAKPLKLFRIRYLTCVPTAAGAECPAALMQGGLTAVV